MGIRAACTLLSVLAVLPTLSCSLPSSTPTEPHRSKIVAFVRGVFAKMSKDYCPMTEGVKWTFTVMRLDPKTGSLMGKGEFVVKNLASRELWGQTVTPQVGVNNDLSFVYEDSTGCYALAHQEATDSEPKPQPNGPECQFKYPAQLGTRWSRKYDFGFFKSADGTSLTAPMTLEIQAMDETITVPAGTFTGCVRVHSRAESVFPASPDLFGNRQSVRAFAELDGWYAPGIGLVKAVGQEKSDNPQFVDGRFVSELTAFTR